MNKQKWSKSLQKIFVYRDKKIRLTIDVPFEWQPRRIKHKRTIMIGWDFCPVCGKSKGNRAGGAVYCLRCAKQRDDNRQKKYMKTYLKEYRERRKNEQS